MGTKSNKLLELHIAYQMKLVESRNLPSTVRREIEEFTTYYSNKKLRDVLPPEKVKNVSLDFLRKLELNDSLLSAFKKLLLANKEILKFEKETIDKYINKKAFFEALDGAIGLKDARNKFIHFAVYSSAYSRMISNIIFAAIKDFFVDQNPLTKNNPLGGAFLKIGGDLLNNLPGMQGNFEGKITEFISKNLSGRIKQSENLIKAELDSDSSKDMLEEFWVFLSGISMSETPGYIDPEFIDRFLSTFPGFWEHIRKSGFIERYTASSIEAFYKEYSEKEFSIALNEIGITKDILDTELTLAITPILDSEEIRSFYRKTLERRFSEFYNSPEVGEILGE